MKKKKRRLLASIITIALIICGINYVEELTRLKCSSARDLSYESYFDYADDYDVLFFGTSHVMYGICPLELWNDYGITSYNWGSPTCTIPSIYWKLMNVLDYATPDLVVVDCFRAVWTDKSYNVERLHEAFDAFNLSLTKYNAINDLMDDTEKYTEMDKLNVLFKLSAYHNRWEELQKKDFDNPYIDTKGGEFEVNVAVPIEISTTSEKTAITAEMEGVNYLRKIIELCQSKNIPILLTYLPYPTLDEEKKEANMIQDIANEYNVDYINFTDIDIVNYDTDYADAFSHMNISGNKKVTEYLGQYIMYNYEITDMRNDYTLSQQWNQDYADLIDWEMELLVSQTSLANYLMLLSVTPVDYIIIVRDKDILFDKYYIELIENLGIDISLINRDSDFVIVRNGSAENTIINNYIEDESIIKTEVGNVQVYYDNDGVYHDGVKGYYSIYVDEEEWLVGNIADDTDVQIVVKKCGECIDNVKFVYDVNLESIEASIIEVYR